MSDLEMVSAESFLDGIELSDTDLTVFSTAKEIHREAEQQLKNAHYQELDIIEGIDGIYKILAKLVATTEEDEEDEEVEGE